MATRPFKTTAQALDWLFSSTNYEQKKIFRYNTRAFNLDRTEKTLSLLGDPHLSYPTIHVAGTKGKGSTCAMVAAILHRAGLGKVGLYTSPHLVELSERIRVNSQPISAAALRECLSLLKGPVEAVTATGLHMKPTFFEIFTVAAFLHFALRKADAAVIEVGLGGRLDATNLVAPVVSAITPISFDHTGVLGTTLGAIAGEKAGTIKEGVPVVVGPQEPQALAAIAAIARQRRATLVVYGRDYFLCEADDGRFEVQTQRRRYRRLRLPLVGRHQRQNAATAIALSQIAAGKIGIRLPAPAVREALAELDWPGRVEIVRRNPTVILDCAHNAASARALASAFREICPAVKAVILIAMAAHKDTGGIIDALAGIAAAFVATTIDSPRSASARELARCIRSKTDTDVAVYSEPDRRKALSLARERAGTGPLVVTGSFYLAGELRAVIKNR
ncbi:MAG: bifunctional folylpolyglutamate synthase/dihydrofolate synthase [Planctomycetes bacterium]|nr:bifunctional folylpolyglutamate synthase/dihydrofolate synthase [Planctomycetota bacterium]